MPSSPDTIYERICGLSRRGFNWDEARGLPVRSDVLDTARDVFYAANYNKQILELLPEADVELNGDGTVSVIYADTDDSSKILAFHIQCENVITYLKTSIGDDVEVEGIIYLENPSLEGLDEVEQLMWWLVSE